jgi:hypothetical protein
MGEQTILVCDVCGRPAVETVTIRVGGRSYVKDFCSTHLSELTAGARSPKRGRRAGTVTKTSTGKRRGRPPKAGAAPKRRGRPKGSTARKASATTRRKKSTA